jgi:GT2 family glycosyltransferase
MPHPRVAVVVPVHNNLPLTLRFLQSFGAVTYPNYEIVIVDDGSSDGTSEHLTEHHPEAVVLRGNGDLWWAGGTNRGVRYALERRFDYVLTINNDACVRPDFLSYLVETAEAHPGSLVGSRIQFMDEPHKVWSAGGWTNWGPGFFVNLFEHSATEDALLARRPNPMPVELLTGCGALVPAACYRRIGTYDERMCPQYHADAELTLRAARRGWRIFVDLRAVVYNDVPNTCMLKSLVQKRSPWYWRPVLAIHLRYCPRGRLLKALIRQYGDVIIDLVYPAPPGDNDPPWERLRKRIRRWLGRAA